MKIFRLILLAVATALAVINIWSVNSQDLWSEQNLWAYFRIGVALIIIVLLVRIIRKTGVKHKKREG